MGLHACSLHLLDHEAPAGTALHGELHIATSLEALLEPQTQGLPGRWLYLTPVYFACLRIHVLEGDLCAVHVETAYDRHRDLLALLFLRTLLRLCRGGPCTCHLSD